ncbi:hypothetical protein GSI_04963 [Ganoderma sinense ZZ0214-1]|uniref:Uncharacterized protein n=1 Tax=Ganoderma sinense ZZ0214-1 TaxID=1077348 RepID=A0A2G8SGF1_9APHY|nr:hypothetical protein GSI_04963 [Ganoderma sinense ZZ0214-1]
MSAGAFMFVNMDAFKAWLYREEKMAELVKGATDTFKAVPLRFKGYEGTELMWDRHSRDGRKPYTKKYLGRCSAERSSEWPVGRARTYEVKQPEV